MIHLSALPRRQCATLFHCRKAAPVCEDVVGHPPTRSVSPFQGILGAYEMYDSREGFLPSVACKDNTLMGASLRLMDTHIFSSGAVNWPPAKCRRPVFKHVSALSLLCTLQRPGK